MAVFKNLQHIIACVKMRHLKGFLIHMMDVLLLQCMWLSGILLCDLSIKTAETKLVLT